MRAAILSIVADAAGEGEAPGNGASISISRPSLATLLPSRAAYSEVADRPLLESLFDGNDLAPDKTARRIVAALGLEPKEV